MFSLFDRPPAMQQDMNEIIPSLYIGNARAAADSGGLFDLVVNCTPSLPFAANDKGGVWIRIAIDDDPRRNQDMWKVITESNVLQQIHDALTNRKNVLVHCHAGMQRSCAVVAFYIMKYYRLSLQDTMNLIKQNRGIAFGGGATFLPALSAFEKL